MNGSSFPTQTVGADSIRPQPRIFASTQRNAHAPVGVDCSSIPTGACQRTNVLVQGSSRHCLAELLPGQALSAPTVGVVPYFLIAFANPSVWVMFISASTHITSTPNSFASACPRSKGSRNSAVDRASATPESPARMETLRQ